MDEEGSINTKAPRQLSPSTTHNIRIFKAYEHRAHKEAFRSVLTIACSPHFLMNLIICEDTALIATCIKNSIEPTKFGPSNYHDRGL